MIDTPIKRIIIKLCLITMILVSVLYGGWLLLTSQHRYVDEVLVVSDRPLVFASQMQIQESVEPLVRDSWYQTSTQQTYDAIASYPGIENIWVKKSWPNQLAIYFKQQQPLAYWNNRQQILLDNGDIIRPRSFISDVHIPQFNGARSQRALLKNKYLALSPLFVNANLEIDMISYLDGQWVLDLSNGAKLILGSDDAEVRVARYLRVINDLPPPDKAKYYDLRYNNGIAVMPIA